MNESNILATLAAAYRGYTNPIQNLDLDAISALVSVEYIDEYGRKLDDSVKIAQRGIVLSLLEKVQASFLKPTPLGQRAYLAGAVLDPASLDLNWERSHPISAGGRGLTPRHAIESCAGELSERLAIYDYGGRRSDRLVAVNLINGDLRPIVPTKVFKSIQNLPQSANSEGCGSGANLQDAVESGLLELVERDAVSLWWRGGQRGASAAFEAEALEAVFGGDQSRSRWLLDVTTDVGTPVMVAISSDLQGGGIVVGAASGWSERNASIKAALELAQMEVAATMSQMKLEKLGEKALLPGDELWIDRLRAYRVDDCALFTPTGRPRSWSNIAGTWNVLLDRLQQMDDRLEFVDITMSEIGIPCVRVRSKVLQPMTTPGVRKRLDDARNYGSPCFPPEEWPKPI